VTHLLLRRAFTSLLDGLSSTHFFTLPPLPLLPASGFAPRFVSCPDKSVLSAVLIRLQRGAHPSLAAHLGSLTGQGHSSRGRKAVQAFAHMLSSPFSPVATSSLFPLLPQSHPAISIKDHTTSEPNKSTTTLPRYLRQVEMAVPGKRCYLSLIPSCT
jgi:hypothetical protein